MINLNPFAISGLLIAVTCFSLMIILLKYGKTRLHRIWALFNLTVAMWGVGDFLVGLSNNASMALFSWRVAIGCGLFISPVFFHTVTTFCNIKKKKFLSYAYGQAVLFCLLMLFTRLTFTETWFVFESIYYTKASFVYNLQLLNWLIVAIYAHLVLFQFSRKTTNVLKRKHSLYLFYGSLIGFIGGTLCLLPFYNILIYPLSNFFIPLYFIIVTYGIFRHQLMDINIAIKKGLVYSVLLAVITAGYLIFVIALGRLFQGLIGYKSFIVNLFAIFTIAILFNPLRDRIQRFLDIRFFKGTLESLAKEKEKLQQELYNNEKLSYVGKLASSIVHEIKSPLTAIKTYVEYLPQKYNDPEFREKFQNLIPKEIERMNHVVLQLLDLSRPREPLFKSVHIANTIDTTLSLLENNLKLKRIEVKKNYSNSDLIIQADEEQLRQVFLNLFLNSIQAMDEGGILTISTSIEHQGSRIGESVTICVQDTGSGISPENLNKLFTPFFTTKQDGVGLGLIVTQEIIKFHNGTIEVESKEGEGTKFIIKLPVSRQT